MIDNILRVENLKKYFDSQEHVIARSKANVKDAATPRPSPWIAWTTFI